MNAAAFIKGPDDEGHESHVPTIVLDKGHRKEDVDIVRVTVGHDAPHPNTEAHHIAWIELYGETKENAHIVLLGRATWAPVYSNPNVRFQINKIEEFARFHALAYCNMHGVWGSVLEQ